MPKNLSKIPAQAVIIVFAAVFISPILIIIISSLREGLAPYAEFFIWNPDYLRALGISMLIAFLSAAGSVAVSIPAAYVFSQCDFRFKGAVFYLYIIVMMMPFQVTLLPQYIVSKALGIYDSPAAMICPAVFSPFAAFLLTQIMKSVPKDSLEAARLDTASTVKIIFRVVAPQMRGGIICAWVLIFTEQWNMVAEPLVLLETRENYPLAVLLSQARPGAFSSAATAIFMLLPLALFLLFDAEIMEGLEGYGMK